MKKYSFAKYLFKKCTFGTFVAIMGAVLWPLQYNVIFGGFSNFLLFMSAQVFVSAQNPPKIPCMVTVISQPH